MLSVSMHGAPGRDPRTQNPVVRSLDLPPGDGSGIARARCLTCHGGDVIVQQRLSRVGWARELDKMIGWGATVDAPERDTLLDYLSVHVGPAGPGAVASLGRAAAALVETRCLTCHDARLIGQQRLTSAGWAREVDKMIGWGASLTEPEKAALIEYLSERRPALTIPALQP